MSFGLICGIMERVKKMSNTRELLGGGIKLKIGFFDSGVGGLTVLYEALIKMPQVDYIYYADTRHVPYGPKSKEEIKNLVMKAVDFIAHQGVDAVVIACNTATSVTVQELRSKYDFPIIGMEPAVKPAVEMNEENKRVLVFATELTLKEKKFKNLVSKIDNEQIVDYFPLGELVQLAETCEFSDEKVLPYLKGKLDIFKLEQYSTVVLGCTHFPFFIDHFQKILPHSVKIIDGANGTVNHLKTMLQKKNVMEAGNGSLLFYQSGELVVENSTLAKYDNLLTRIKNLRRSL